MRHEDLSRYDLSQEKHPFWCGGTVLQESVVFPEPKDGGRPSARLLYRPSGVISMRSSDLQTEFAEGKDFVVEGDRVILTENSRMNVLLRSVYEEPADQPTCGWATVHPGILYRPTDFFVLREYTYYFSYETKETWQGPLPENVADDLPLFRKRLLSGAPMTWLWYGDSQVFGCDVSDLYHVAPNVPPYAKIVTDSFASAYPQAKISYVNTAVGGTDSVWGRENVAERVCAHRPDLLCIKFGSNEVQRPVAEYKQSIKKLLETVLNEKPDTEIVLLSPFAHNEECLVYHNETLVSFEKAHEEIRREMSSAHIAVSAIYAATREMVKQKGFASLTYNMINHANDFGCRVNAQLILRTLGFYS